MSVLSLQYIYGSLLAHQLPAIVSYFVILCVCIYDLGKNIYNCRKSQQVKDHHHHHHFICPIIQQYAHLRKYDSRRTGQQGPIKTLTAALKVCLAVLNLLPVPSLPALGPWAVCKLTRYALLVFVRSCSSINNKIISFKKIISPRPDGAPQKEKYPGALGTCPVCRLVKTVLSAA